MTLTGILKGSPYLFIHHTILNVQAFSLHIRILDGGQAVY